MADEIHQKDEPRPAIVIPEHFSYAHMVEELNTTIRMKQETLERRMNSGKIGHAEIGLARLSIAKLRSLERYMKSVGGEGIKAEWPAWLREADDRQKADQAEAAVFMEKSRAFAAENVEKIRADLQKLDRPPPAPKVDEKPVPPVQTLPPEPAPVVQQAPAVEEEDDPW